MCATGTLPVANQIRIARRTETDSRHCRQRREKREVKAFIVRSSSQSLVWSTPRSPGRDQCVERSGAASHHIAPHDQRQYDGREDHHNVLCCSHPSMNRTFSACAFPLALELLAQPPQATVRWRWLGRARAEVVAHLLVSIAGFMAPPRRQRRCHSGWTLDAPAARVA